MNRKAESFNQYLKEKKIDVFQVEEVENDAMGTVIFRSYMDIEGQRLPTLVILDNSIFAQIRVVLLQKARNDEKVLDILNMLNEENAKYKPFKCYLNPEGDCILDLCMILDKDEVNGDLVYAMFKVIIDYLEENYRKIMKAIW